MPVTTTLEVAEVKVLLALQQLGGHIKNAKADFKSQTKSYISEKKVNHERYTSGSKSHDSWSKAKVKLIDDEFNKRRRTNACINCAEAGHTFFN
jgi:hypothetical protein